MLRLLLKTIPLTTEKSSFFSDHQTPFKKARTDSMLVPGIADQHRKLTVFPIRVPDDPGHPIIRSAPGSSSKATSAISRSESIWVQRASISEDNELI